MFTIMRSLASLIVISGLAGNAVAQTFNYCDPMESDDCPIRPALSMEYDFDWSDPTNATT